MARLPKYNDYVKPRLKEISEWARAGATNEEIASALGVGYSSFCSYIGKYQELSDSLKEARKSGVPEVKNALYRRAVGFEYEEKKTYMKKDEDGQMHQYVEITKKQALPDIAAIQTYLRNYSDGFRDRDKISYELREMEIGIRKMLAENQVF